MMPSKLRRTSLFRICFLSLVIFAANIMISPDIFAINIAASETEKDLLPRIYMTNIEKCKNNMISPVKTTNGGTKVANNNGSTKTYFPNGMSSFKKAELKCDAMFKKLDSDLGSGTPANISKALKKLGYEPSSGKGSGKCIQFPYKVINPQNGATYQEGDELKICAGVDSDDELISDSITMTDNGLHFMSQASYHGNLIISIATADGPWETSCYATKWSKLEECLKGRAVGPRDFTLERGDFFGNGEIVDTKVLDINKGSINVVETGTSIAEEYKLPDTGFKPKTVYENYGWGKNTSPNFTDYQVVTLYQSYLNRYATVVCTENKERQDNLSNDYKQFRGVNINDSGKSSENCYAKTKGNPPSKFNGVNGSSKKWGTKVKFSEMLDQLSSMTVNENTKAVVSLNADSDIEGAEGGTITDKNTEEAGESWCFQNGGALGWIVCPIIDAMHSFLKWAYDTFMEPFLQTPVGIFSEGNEALRQAWNLFRNFANIAFVILILVVVISQLTGVGIDNYGIKKILPKIIIAAILINLSYIICQLAVDLSNILGSGFRNLFENFGAQIYSDPQAAGADSKVSWFQHWAAPIGAVVAVGSATVAFNATGFAVLFPILLSALTALLALLFVWMLLIVRQAGVIMLVVISPLAFACYILPNTKKLFDKWLSIFKALLVLYPLCGLVIGAGNFAGMVMAKVTEGSDHAWIYQIAAMVLSVVPFFLLPTLLRSSLNAMGNIGSRISGIGQNLGRRANQGIRNSDRYRKWDEDQRNNTAERRAQRLHDRLSRRGSLSNRNTRRLSRANATLKDAARRRQEAEIGANVDNFNASMAKQAHELNESAMADLNYNDADYVAGREAQGRLSRENDLEGARLYVRPGFEASRRNQYEANRHSEIRKMYSDQYANMGASDMQRMLATAATGSGVDSVEQVDALFDSLMASNSQKELLDTINGMNVHSMDSGVRDRLMQKAIASGNTVMKGWAKANTSGTGPVNMQDYIDHGGLQTYLSTKVGEHALDNADKDTLQFLAANNGTQALSDQMIANAAMTSANQNADSTSAVVDMIHQRAAATGSTLNIGDSINAEGLTKLNVQTANAIHHNNGSKNGLDVAIRNIKSAGNETIRSKVDSGVAKSLGL